MKLTMCGDDSKTTGHVSIIAVADLLATAVLNEDEPIRIQGLAQAYQALRIESARQAGINAKNSEAEASKSRSRSKCQWCGRVGFHTETCEGFTINDPARKVELGPGFKP